MLAASCSTLKVEHASKLQEAQDIFNVAAEMELELKSNPSDGGIIAPITRIDANYRTAHAMLSSLIQEQKEAMSADSLLGTAYTLKALIEWRLGEFNASINTSKEANIHGVHTYPRDKALLNALPSLIKNDQARQFMDSQMATYSTVEELLKGSVSGLNELTNTDPMMNSMRLYLLTSQLSALKNWLDLKTEPQKYTSEMPADDFQTRHGNWCESLRGVWGNFTTEVSRLNTEEDREPDSGKACSTYNEFSRVLVPGACSIERPQGYCTDS